VTLHQVDAMAHPLAQDCFVLYRAPRHPPIGGEWHRVEPNAVLLVPPEPDAWR
jgi:hypothetical protein